MRLGMIGLGRMGGNMVRRLLRDGHRPVVFDLDAERVRELSELEGVEAAGSLEDVVARLRPPRVLWVMVPAGEATGQTLRALAAACDEGDVLVDGGNSNFQDTVRRAEELAATGVRLVDAGTSGGVWGLEVGYCLMVGGEREAFERVEPALRTLAPPDGYAHVGPSGAGHFVKMVHNGIEYGLMQAYAEGFELLHASPFGLDLRGVARLWNQGSVVRSWLLELAERAFEQEGRELAGLSDWVGDSGEGRWTVQAAVDLDVPAPVITASLFARFRSRQESAFAGRLLAALRNQFGGHAVRRAGEPGDPVATDEAARPETPGG